MLKGLLIIAVLGMGRQDAAQKNIAGTPTSNNQSKQTKPIIPPPIPSVNPTVSAPSGQPQATGQTQPPADEMPWFLKAEWMLENSPFRGEGNKQIKGFGFEIFVCLDYQSTLDPTKHHQTQSCYLVGHKDTKTMTVSGLFLPSRSYPAEEIVLTFKGFGAYAD